MARHETVMARQKVTALISQSRCIGYPGFWSDLASKSGRPGHLLGQVVSLANTE
jgi:hypothetical protein